MPFYTTVLFLEYFYNLFNTSFKNNLKFLFKKYYYIKVYIKKIPKYVIKKYFQIVLLMSKLLLCNFLTVVTITFGTC
jgi:hypothetical protein